MGCREGWYEKKYSKCSDSKRRSKCWNDHDDDCWKEFKECKKDRNEKCDCCCTTGIFQTLRALRGRTVVIALRGVLTTITGTVVSVNCDVVTLTIAGPPVATLTLSLCEIIAVLEVPPTPAAEVPAEFRNLLNGNN
ncbi:hypothetical protein KFD70_22595 [Bacillus pfraonensis]|uniref:hypothetical protein n=1 Tax=Bacillus TaxID=1386 RepID=UPI002A538EE4|nr:hypothetical protein [Bacillus pseudomycoides]